MKTITIRLPDVESAMPVKVQKVQKFNKAYRDINALVISQAKWEFEKAAKTKP